MQLEMFEASEYAEIKGSSVPEICSSLNLSEGNTEGCEYLGIVTENGIWKASCYIGHVWLKKREVSLRVYPKPIIYGQDTDFFRMFLDSLSDAVVSKHLENCYGILFDDPPIDAENSDNITLFIIARYLKELNDLSRRLMKQNFHRIEENLTGKIKGKILMHRQVSENIFCARAHYATCSYQVITKDCIENQVLKAALVLCCKYLTLHASSGLTVDGVLHQWANNGKMALEGVTVRRVFPHDMRQAIAKSKGFFCTYQESLRLAEMIFRRLSFDPSADVDKIMSKCPPYWINANELFERYCEVLLRKNINSELWVGYQRNNMNSDIGMLRPDFLLPEKNAVLDAKYRRFYQKKWGEWDDIDRKKGKDNLQQLSLYGRLDEVKRRLNNCEPELIILYPVIGNKMNSINIDSDFREPARLFHNIYKIGVTVPTRISKNG
ncbi:MAG: hypothetical protein HQK96_13720 [Nitrospirae bacterium]|nr:hypothetical protein [Nitrospirota bacterium]